MIKSSPIWLLLLLLDGDGGGCGEGNACVDISTAERRIVGVDGTLMGGWQSDPELVNSQIGKLGDPTNTLTQNKGRREWMRHDVGRSVGRLPLPCFKKPPTACHPPAKSATQDD